jgi:hypothetical protein
MSVSKEEKDLDIGHVELARETSSVTDLAGKPAGHGGVADLATLPVIHEGSKGDAAMEILHGERVEMTDEQVSSYPLGLSKLNHVRENLTSKSCPHRVGRSVARSTR